MSGPVREDKLKVLLVGPKEVGKSCIANHIAGYKSVIGQEYRPTIGLRICEFERLLHKGTKKASVEMWDVSGDTNFENCWAAISQDAHGVIIVFNPEEKTALKDLEFWYTTFVKRNQIEDTCCLVLSHYKKANAVKGDVRLPKVMSKVASCHTNLEGGQTNANEAMWSAMDTFLERVLDRVREKDESMMN